MMEIAIVITLAVIAFGALMLPLLRGRGAATDAMTDASVEEQVQRYRDAVRADTVCRRCGQANPPASRYCFECGRQLATKDAEEFDGTGEAA
jgi:ribosomal protein L40E